MKRYLSVFVLLFALTSVLPALGSPAEAARFKRHVFITANETIVRFDGMRDRISLNGDIITVGPDVRITLRELGSDDIEVLRKGRHDVKLVLWHRSEAVPHVQRLLNAFLIHLGPLESPPVAPSPQEDSAALVTESATTSTTTTTDHDSMDHDSMDHTPAPATAPKPVVVPDDAVTPYVTPFKKSVTNRSQIGFSVSCDLSHTAKDDPIVFPGQSGRSHLHDFFGSTVTDAFTTAADLRAGSTTCTSSDDKSAYWVPELYANGVRQEPTNTTFYYKPGVADRSSIQPIPYGLEVVAGNAGATGPQKGQYFWFQEFGNASNNTNDGTMIRATQSGRITLRVVYPDCWDGKRLSSPDQSHVAYHTNKRTCPSTHPVAMPQLMMFVTYGTNGNGVSLASGAWYTIHADFFNAWTPATQQRLIDECIKPSVRCGGVYDADSKRIPRRG